MGAEKIMTPTDERIPEWKLFLHRQLVRNMVSTILCEQIVDSGVPIPVVADRCSKTVAEVVYSLRPENCNMDDIADLCCAMNVRPVFAVRQAGGVVYAELDRLEEPANAEG